MARMTPSLQVGLAAHKVENFVGIVAHQQAVDGEVAAGNIFFGPCGIDHLIGVTAIGIAEVAAERWLLQL